VHENDDIAVRRVRTPSRTVAPARDATEPSTGVVPTLNLLQRAAGNQAVTTFLETKGLIGRHPGDPTGEQGGAAEKQDALGSSAPESHWVGGIKGDLGEHPSAYHTLNNYGDAPLEYVLRIKNEGHCLLSLETQYEYKTTGLQRAWTAIAAQGGHTEEVTNGLPPGSSLHLRLFGERDATQPDRTDCEGTLEVELKK
jgi:hypothetical protein